MELQKTYALDEVYFAVYIKTGSRHRKRKLCRLALSKSFWLFATGNHIKVSPLVSIRLFVFLKAVYAGDLWNFYSENNSIDGVTSVLDEDVGFSNLFGM